MLEITILQLLGNTLSISSQFSSPNQGPKKNLLPVTGEQRLINSGQFRRNIEPSFLLRNGSEFMENATAFTPSSFRKACTPDLHLS